jgi:hypothetical protein
MGEDISRIVQREVSLLLGTETPRLFLASHADFLVSCVSVVDNGTSRHTRQNVGMKLAASVYKKVEILLFSKITVYLVSQLTRETEEIRRTLYLG